VRATALVVGEATFMRKKRCRPKSSNLGALGMSQQRCVVDLGRGGDCGTGLRETVAAA
jgi:hypothetical protein